MRFLSKCFLSNVHTHIHAPMDASEISLGLVSCPKIFGNRLKQPGIETPAIQLVDDLLYFLSYSHPKQKDYQIFNALFILLSLSVLKAIHPFPFALMKAGLDGSWLLNHSYYLLVLFNGWMNTLRAMNMHKNMFPGLHVYVEEIFQ